MKVSEIKKCTIQDIFKRSDYWTFIVVDEDERKYRWDDHDLKQDATKEEVNTAIRTKLQATLKKEKRSTVSDFSEPDDLGKGLKVQ